MPTQLLGMLRQLVQRRHASNASDAGRGHACPISGRLTRLDKQVRTCVRALKNAGVEFILAWRITGETPHLDLHTAPPRPHVVRDVIADLERPQAGTLPANVSLGGRIDSYLAVTWLAV